MKPPEVAIIPAAGKGTRHLPVTQVVPKELLPVATRPLIDWAIEGCLAGGIRTLCIVESPDKPLLREYLLWRWKLRPERGAATRFQATDRDLCIELISQPEPCGLGDVMLRCRRAVGERWFAWVMPDWAWAGGDAPLAQLRRAAAEPGARDLESPVFVTPIFEVTAAEADGFGNCGLYQGPCLPNGWLRIGSLGSKQPGPLDLGGAERAWRGIGACWLAPAFLEVAAELAAAPRRREAAEFDDVPIFQQMLGRGPAYGIPVTGQYFDAGQPVGYARAHAACGPTAR